MFEGTSGGNSRGTQGVTSDRVLAFHRGLPGYAPTPLVDARYTAGRLGVARVWVKDESQRFDLGAYKILGASWAAACALERHGGGPVELVAASEGNHGRAVARAARWMGVRARIFIPSSAASWRVERIRGEQAEVEIAAEDYDATVIAAAAYADHPGRLFLSDTAIQGDEPSPRDVVEGYSTLFREIEDAGARPTVVAVQMGVGSLGAAAVRHYAGDHPTARVVGVEPQGADCIGQSIAAGRLVETAGPYDARMAGLNCGRMSISAWPVLRDGLSACVAVPPDRAALAAEWLAADGVFTSPTGAAGLAGLMQSPLAAADRIVLIATEGRVILV